jgi:hypothetical protein
MTSINLIMPAIENKPGWIARVRGFVHEINEPFAEMATFDVCAVVTLVLLFLYVGERWYLTTPTKALSLLALFIPTLRHRPHIWFSLFTLMMASNYHDRFIIDNHKYLMTYWVLVMIFAANSTCKERADRILLFNGRILIGLAFLFAVLAKVISHDYLTGGFFRETIQLDSRFTNFAWLVGGLDRHGLVDVRKMVDDLRTAYLLNVDIGKVHLISSARLTLIVWFMTLWTIGIESAVALSFLWPWPSRFFETVRRYCLWIFLFTTYSVAFVPGFAWTLTVMGLAQTPKSQARLRIVYILLVAVVLQIYQLPWVNLIRSYWN